MRTWRNGGIITGEREFLGREFSETSEEMVVAAAVATGSVGINWERGIGGSPGVKKPT